MTCQAGETFRYAVQKTPEAKASAWKHFEGMLLLNSVTGIKGLMARSLVNVNNMACSSGPCDMDHVWPKHDPASQKGGRPCNWVNSTSNPDLKWKCDTSNDEVVGHYFAYLVVAELLAEVSKHDEFCIENGGFCIKNEEFCIQNDELCRRLRRNGS